MRQERRTRSSRRTRMAVATPHPTIARDHCLAPSRTVDSPLDGARGRYGRLFPELAAFDADEEFLLRLGGGEGPCDAGLTAVEEGAEGGDDAGVAAGWPLFGQFIAHDITADRSLLLRHADPDHVANFRSPRANLECLYGDGPVGNPFLYEHDDHAKLLLGTNDIGEPADLPRNSQGIALVGDPLGVAWQVGGLAYVVRAEQQLGVVIVLVQEGVADGAVAVEALEVGTWRAEVRHVVGVGMAKQQRAVGGDVVGDELPEQRPASGHPSVVAALRALFHGGEAGVAGAFATAEAQQELLVGVECRELGEQPPVPAACAVQRRVHGARRCEAVVPRDGRVRGSDGHAGPPARACTALLTHTGLYMSLASRK